MRVYLVRGKEKLKPLLLTIMCYPSPLPRIPIKWKKYYQKIASVVHLMSYRLQPIYPGIMEPTFQLHPQPHHCPTSQMVKLRIYIFLFFFQHIQVYNVYFFYTTFFPVLFNWIFYFYIYHCSLVSYIHCWIKRSQSHSRSMLYYVKFAVL